MEKSIHESAIWIPRCGVNNETCGFVDDNEILVFMENIEGDILRNNRGGLGFWKVDRDAVPIVDRGFGLCLGSINDNVPLLEENLYTGA